MRDRLAARLATPGLPRLAALVGVLLCLPALGTGLIMDDWFHRAILMELPGLRGLGAPWRSLFTFVPGPGRNDELIALGIMPWWSDPDLRVAFLRPLPALLHQLDFLLWRDHPWLQHAHSLGWWGLAAWLVARLYRRLLGPTVVAGLAALLFAVDDDHAMVIGWIAGRNGLVALVLGALCLGLHVAGRRGAALLAAAAGLLAGEPFVGALAYVVAWEGTATGPLWSRLLRLLPYGLLLAGWRLWAHAEGYGAVGSGLYVDPGRQPLEFLTAVAERGPWLLAGGVLGVPVDLWLFLPRAQQLTLAWVFSVALAAVAIALWPLVARRREGRFLLLGALLAVVPPCGAFPTGRLLMWAGVGLAGLLALAAAEAGLLGPVEHPRRRPLVLALVAVHLVLAAALLPARILALPALASAFHVGALEGPRDPALAHQVLVYVNGAELTTGYTGLIRDVARRTRVEHGLPADDLPVPMRVALLSPMATGSLVARLDAHTLQITPDGGFLASTMDQMFRSEDRPFTAGQRIVLRDFTATVPELTADGRPATVELRFAEPLEGGLYRFVAIVDGALVAWPLPPVGEARRLEASLPRVDPWPLSPLLRPGG